MLLGGDLNARIGEEDTFDFDIEKKERKTNKRRHSKDRIINREGR